MHAFVVSLLITLSATQGLAAVQSSRSGFISIDCGLEESTKYHDDYTDINYISDAGYIDAGINMKISKEYQSATGSFGKLLSTVRSFPQGNNNCYTLKPQDAQNRKYLIRAFFKYGNYDSKNQNQILFKLFLDVNEWLTVNITSASDILIKEIIHKPNTDYIHVCLVNIGWGTPFISALELRELSNTIYNSEKSLALLGRFDHGSESSNSDYERYPDDIYDRIWRPSNFGNWERIKANYVSEQFSENEYKPSAKVMSTAVKPIDGTSLAFSPGTDGSEKLYVFMYFLEVENQTRKFSIYLNDVAWPDPQTVIVPDNYPKTIHNSYCNGAIDSLNFTLKKTEDSTLPPIQNAVEYYTIKNFPQSPTEQKNVDTMISIKKLYRIKKNWQGDPCVPDDFSWEGVECSKNDQGAIKIISLNLSFSGLTNNITSLFAGLDSLQTLDLSNNSLAGIIPDFLAEMRSLRTLNLSGNKLNGTIPHGLAEKSNSRSLALSIDDANQDLCSSGACNEKKKKSRPPKAVIIGTVLGVSCPLLLVTAAILLKCIRKPKGLMGSNMEITEVFENGIGRIHEGMQQLKDAIQSLSESLLPNQGSPGPCLQEVQSKTRKDMGENGKSFSSKFPKHEFPKFTGDDSHFGRTDDEDFDEDLSRIKQTGALQDYQKEFEQLATRVRGWAQKTLVDTFMGGLKTEIAEDIQMFKPKTVKEAMSYAQMKEDQLQKHDRASQLSNEQSTSPSTSSIATNNQVGVQKLPSDEMQKRKTIGLCFSCNENFTAEHQCQGSELATQVHGSAQKTRVGTFIEELKTEIVEEPNTVKEATSYAPMKKDQIQSLSESLLPNQGSPSPFLQEVQSKTRKDMSENGKSFSSKFAEQEFPKFTGDDSHFGRTDDEDFDESLSRIEQTRALQDYQKEFEQLATRVRGWAQKTLVDTFMGGLKTEIAEDIQMFKPKTVKEAMSYTQMKEDQIQKHGRSCQLSNEQSASPFTSSVATNNQVRVQKIPLEEMQQQKAMGLCFSCNEKFTTGHHCQGSKLATRVHGWAKKTLVDTFMGGLKTEIAEDIQMSKSKTVKEAMSYGQMEDQIQKHGGSCQLSSEQSASPFTSFVATNNQVGAQKLPSDEMLKQKAMGLCFSCNRKFTTGHHCQGSKLATRVRGWAQKTLVGTFMGGLKTEIAEEPNTVKIGMSSAQMKEDQIQKHGRTCQLRSEQSTSISTSYVAMNNQVGVKKLPSDEIQKRRAMELCIRCDEKLTAGHQCQGSKLMSIEGPSHEVGTPALRELPEVSNNGEELEIKISES